MTSDRVPATGPALTLPRNRLLLIGSAALGVSLLPGWVLYLRRHLGLDVRVVLTPAATGLVSPTALAALSGHPVPSRTDEAADSGVVPHREIAEWPDLVLFAPATGNSVSKAALGLADNLALTVWSFSPAVRVLVPSLTELVGSRPQTRRHLDSLRADGVQVMDGATGYSPSRDAEDSAAMPNIIQVLDYVSRIPGLAVHQHTAHVG